MSNRPIRDIIRNQKLCVATPGTRVAEAAALMKNGNLGAVLVVNAGQFVGIFTERDAVFRVLAEGLDPEATRLDEVMTHAPRTIGPDRPFGHALHLMFEGGFRHVPVVDKGELVGIVSARDALGSDLAQFETDVLEREHITEIL